VGRPVDPSGEAAHDRDARGSESFPQNPRDSGVIRGRPPRSHDCHRGPRPAAPRPPQVHHGGRVVKAAQPGRVSGIEPRKAGGLSRPPHGATRDQHRRRDVRERVTPQGPIRFQERPPGPPRTRSTHPPRIREPALAARCVEDRGRASGAAQSDTGARTDRPWILYPNLQKCQIHWGLGSTYRSGTMQACEGHVRRGRVRRGGTGCDSG
jgi:hypothetical protein